MKLKQLRLVTLNYLYNFPPAWQSEIQMQLYLSIELWPEALVERKSHPTEPGLANYLVQHKKLINLIDLSDRAAQVDILKRQQQQQQLQQWRLFNAHGSSNNNRLKKTLGRTQIIISIICKINALPSEFVYLLDTLAPQSVNQSARICI